MKIAFPTEDNKGMSRQVFGHFGSASHFIIVDSISLTPESTTNPDREHQHGMCQPLEALSGKTVDAVAVGGIGWGALQRLNDLGITTYRAVEGTVSENLGLIKAGLLPLFKREQTCTRHSGGEECMK